MEKDLVFEPNEFEIIEVLDFQEEVQRPEELRFFTLDEQLIDYYDKVLPKKKFISKTEKKKISQEVDRLQEIYEKNVTITDVDYRVDKTRKSVNVDWVKSIYGPFEYKAYSWKDSWLPLFEQSRRSTPNYYGPMIAALPSPYASDGQSGVPITNFTKLLNEEGKKDIHALGPYQRTKRILHDDGTFEIVQVSIPNTTDNIRSVGFFIEQRDLEIPRPLSEHPFLSSNGSKEYLTNEPLNTVFPSVEAIMSHAIPTTTDPYNEGLKYLKIYDVNFHQIPWNSWKERFPPVDTIMTTPPIMSIQFPKPDISVAPSKDVQNAYNSEWKEGVFPRLWLMNQEDGGQLVIKSLISNSGENGLVPPENPVEKPEVQLPLSQPEECLKVDNFEEFLSSGVYRTTNKQENCRTYVTDPGVCAPTSFITQEKQEQISKGKKPWSETTPTDILKEHQFLLKVFQHIPQKEEQPTYEKYIAKERSEMKHNIDIILADTEIEDSDKRHNILLLVRQLEVKNNIYIDVEGRKVVCMHTLEVLGGELERDRLEFYRNWTTVEDGFQVCKSCGERVNDDNYEAQDDFDDEGHAIVSHDVLEDRTVHQGETQISSLTNSLGELKSIFDLNNAGELVVFMLLSILQILPSESQLLPILTNLREVSAAAKKSAKLSVSDKRRVEGILGIAASVVLLQTHNPFLIPRRSFGSKVFKLSGFPRDTTDDKESDVLDNVLFALKQTFEQFSSSFKEPVATVLRAIISDRKKVRDEAVRYINQAYNKFKADFQVAKERYNNSVEDLVENDIKLPLIVPKKYDFKPNEKQGDEKIPECESLKPFVVITPKLDPKLVQDKVELLSGLQPSKLANFLQSVPFKYSYLFPDKKEITRTFKLGFPKSVKLDAIENFIKSENDGIALLSLLNRLLDILSELEYPVNYIIPYRQFATSLDTRESSSLIRDAVRGMLYELFDSIQGEDKIIEGIRVAMNRDLPMRMILMTKEAAEKEVNVTRAKERETFKMRMRAMNDEQREITKRLLDLGIADYIITNEDRELIAREYGEPVEKEFEEELPEEGIHMRDLMEDDVPIRDDGEELDIDRGDYGDRVNRPFDDYANTVGNYDDNEGDGI